ncbi:MAG TPA: radical SAM protein [Tenuifilaceae bacterium]|jgi:wyosine [tRNA(Phe)-imidazoG37] synthetase (radical SAM superfamily)|nr:radical SAM protein [Tenuifilaceae bacterium]
MATFLFEKIIFGPVRSRRLGVSLGVNLLPNDAKICNFDCIYCECGWTMGATSSKLPTRTQVRESMQKRFQQMRANDDALDVITFAGNGEPTIHPHFAEIIDDTIALRNEYFPHARIAVLSNSTMLHKPAVVEALKRVDQNILKLDSGFDATIQLLNQPKKPITVGQIVDHLKQFDGNFTLQTLFVRGIYNGQPVDNATPRELECWVEIVNELQPKDVMVYTIARDTPIDTLKKVPQAELESIAERVRALGIPVQVSC